MDTILRLDQALHAAGELLERRGARAAIVVVGGAALNLLGVITRATRDVDVIATATPRPRGDPAKVRRPVLPRALVEVIATVARDQGLPGDWLNTVVAGQWDTGLPRGFASRVAWSRYGGLWVGLAGRVDLIHLKLYAAADSIGPSSRHVTDLIALEPTPTELAAAARWITRSQDPSAAVAEAVARVIAYVQDARR